MPDSTISNNETPKCAARDLTQNMCQFSLDIEHPYYLSCGNLASLGTFISGCGHSRALVITDTNVDRHWGEQIESGLGDLPHGTAVLAAGEASKTSAVLMQLYKQMLSFEADRQTAIIGIGGGVISDIAGFAASTYMRGLPLYLVPTTLLAMVDASIGGKNGLDLPEGKNLIGTFYQPQAVFTDLHLLSTLPLSELSNGLAETLKTAIIGDAEMFAELEQLDLNSFTDRPLLPSPNLRYHPIFCIVQRAVTVKSQIVVSDFHETGERKKLNLGHTLGHALEAAGKYSELRHGEAVSLGMLAAIRIAQKRSFLAEDENLEERVTSMLTRWKLPVRIPRGITWDDTVRAIRRDKKRQEQNLVLVLPRAVGDTEIVTGIDEECLHEVFMSLLE